MGMVLNFFITLEADLSKCALSKIFETILLMFHRPGLKSSLGPTATEISSKIGRSNWWDSGKKWEKNKGGAEQDTSPNTWDLENWLNQGSVVRFGDGIAFVDGLTKVGFGEIVGITIYQGIYPTERFGIVLDLLEKTAGIAILGPAEGIEEGSVVTRKGRSADVPTGFWALGRMINALG